MAVPVFFVDILFDTRKCIYYSKFSNEFITSHSYTLDVEVFPLGFSKHFEKISKNYENLANILRVHNVVISVPNKFSLNKQKISILNTIAFPSNYVRERMFGRLSHLWG